MTSSADQMARRESMELDERGTESPRAEHERDENLITTTEQPTEFTTVEDIPPDGGYGWVVTLCVFLANAHTWGINASWAVFLNHFLTANTFPNATKFQFSIIGGLSISQALLVGPLVVRFQSRFGLRTTMMLGSLTVATALVTSGSATQTWHLILSQGICFGWGMGFIYIPVRPIFAVYFAFFNMFQGYRSSPTLVLFTSKSCGGLRDLWRRSWWLGLQSCHRPAHSARGSGLDVSHSRALRVGGQHAERIPDPRASASSAIKDSAHV